MLNFHDGDTRVKVLVGRRQVAGARAEIDVLRTLTDQADDFLTSVDRFLTWVSIWKDLPVAFLMYRRATLYGVAYLSFRLKHGIPVGLVKAGNLAGQGGVIAAQVERIAVLETASRVLLRSPFAHTVMLSTTWASRPTLGQIHPVNGVAGGWHFREERYRLDLTGGLEPTMDRLGYKMRRNLRYYRRRAQTEFGCVFVADMSVEQRQEAVAALFDKGTYKTEADRAHLVEAALRSAPGQFAMGLRDGQGNWLSYIAGWRGGGGTSIDWQLNCDSHESASISTAMRAYCLEHEIGLGGTAIIFVGGTSPFWSRVCELSVCGDLVATRIGPLGSLARRLARWLRPAGRVAGLISRVDPSASAPGSSLEIHSS